ncbi:MAG: hypothetical protein Q9210_007216, partial [Variospora velana]
MLDITALIPLSAIKEVIIDVCRHARKFHDAQYPAMPTFDACFLWNQGPLSCIFPERERALLKTADSCNYECGFCFHTAKTSYMLPKEDAKRGLKLLAEAGMRKINFAGGEPFLYPAFLGELVRYCKEDLHLESVSIVTNGSLVKEKWLETHGKYLDIMAVSCDSFNECTNMLIGRGKGTHLETFVNLSQLCRKHNVKFKVNTVVCRYNFDEDMNAGIEQVAPFRWKCFQVLVVPGENDSSATLRNAQRFVISDEDYGSFCEKHEHQKSFVPESNAVMKSSYLILDEYMRFLNKGVKEATKSILEVGVPAAMDNVYWDDESFARRGGENVLRNPLGFRLYSVMTANKSAGLPMAEYKQLGKSGLRVSVPILGAMSFGDKRWAPWVIEEDEALPLLKAAYNRGLNTWDTANVYSNGASEEIIGKAIKKYNLPRHKLVILTKCCGTTREGNDPETLALKDIDQTVDYVNQRGLSRQGIFNAVEASLRRLDIPYIDVFQIHRYDKTVPVEETMEALHDLVKSGKVRYIGASSMWAYQFATMQFVAERRGWTKFVSMQNQYSLLYREEEREMNKFCYETG